MMDKLDLTPEQILKTAKTLGVSLRVEGDQLIANPKSKLTPMLTAAIQEADADENRNPRNPRSDTNSSPHKAAEQADRARPMPGTPPAPAEATSAPTAGNPNDTGESPEPTPREAQAGYTPAEPPESVALTAAATAEALGLDFVAAKLEANSRPPGDDFIDRTCAPYLIRVARESGLEIRLDDENRISLSAWIEVWQKNSRLIRWIEERTALVAEVLAHQCGWCEEVGEGELIDGLFCKEECRDQAREFERLYNSAGRAQGDK